MIERTEKIRNLPVSFDIFSTCVRLDINTLGELLDYPKEKMLRDRRVSRKNYLKIMDFIKVIRNENIR